MSRTNKERRATFRVAIGPDSGLQAAFVIGGDAHEARAANLSATGIFVRPLDRWTAPRLKTSDKVLVELKYAGQALFLSGVVCSFHDGGYGIHFPRQDDDGYQNPREQLAAIAGELQRKTLLRRPDAG